MTWESGVDTGILPCVKQLAGSCWATQESQLSSLMTWIGGMRGGRASGVRRFMRTYSWLTVLYCRNQHNIVKQPYSNKKRRRRRQSQLPRLQEAVGDSSWQRGQRAHPQSLGADSRSCHIAHLLTLDQSPGTRNTEKWDIYSGLLFTQLKTDT